ncbi:diacylglycerol kinase 7-like [Cucurbita maxima]|uniref:Diacylglycerol kinase n=1 Tax=Cucurbita maxima TaxID=3661 RepID=A0A6J1I0M6_CUCMA|nr:diacylglycerol kinase 7-like [Cucurbita maxima]
MDSPTSGGEGDSTTRIAAQSSVVDSLKGFGFTGIKIDKDELRKQLRMPQYLRYAMRDSIRLQDPGAGETWLPGARSISGSSVVPEINDGPPESPMVVFINPRSGGRHGPLLKERLQMLISEEQVFDLTDVKPHEFVRYGLRCLELLAGLGDACAKEIREKMRVMVAGGDGTVGWVLGCLLDLEKSGRLPVPPVGIIPLGTGNDLSRTFGWGGSFPFAWKSAIKKSLDRATTGQIRRLDSWHVTLATPSTKIVKLPHCMKPTEVHALDESLEIEESLPEKAYFHEGVFYNYFSIGMDAQVAYGFHQLRDEKPYLAQGPISNKLIYSGYSCSQGWFFTPCISDPSLRGLKHILRMHVKKVNCSDWEEVLIPSSVRSLVALNLNNYGSGRHPWGNLTPEYMERRGFVEAHVDDGLLEVFGLKQGWHASLVMGEVISAKHIVQAAAIRFELRGGEWKHAFLQMDGEPWKQPMSRECLTYVEIKRVPSQSLMINGE